MTEQYPVLEGAEPFYHEGGRTGILVSHGFTGTTQSMRPLFEAYAAAGYTVCAPRLKGHGTHYLDLEQCTYPDWIASVEEAYEWLKLRCDTIFVTGLSMGGTLTLYMAEHHPEIRGIIPINPGIRSPELEEAYHLEGVRFLPAIGSDIKKPGVVELAYEQVPHKALREALDLMGVVRDQLAKVKCPTLLFVSPEDHVIPAYSSQIVYDSISSEIKEIRELPNSYHVATLDNDQQAIIDGTLEFMKKLA